MNQTCGAVSDAGPLVLVAEDDESAASAVMLMLARDGISCVRAVNGPMRSSISRGAGPTWLSLT